jgi:malonyl-CoA/methylmalonyl-CoA synthetase
VSTILDLLARAAVRSGATALELGVAGATPRALSFADVRERSRRTAALLRARGLRPGDRLAVQLSNRLEFLDLYLGCLQLGAIFLPVNVLYREREVGHIVADARPRAVVTTPELAPLVPAGTATWDVDELAAAAGGHEALPDDGPRDDAPAAIVYTSGTTGRAKGAVLTHGNLAANALTLVDAWRVTAADRYLAVLPLFHVHGLGNGVGCWLASGCRMRLVERFEQRAALALFDEFQPTLFFGVPTVYVRLLELPDDAARRIGGRARLFVSGSAPLPPRVFEAFRRRFGHAVLERYGMTETLMTIGNPYDGERRPGSVGRPFPGVEARIVDASGADVAEHETGELLVRGPSVFAGYWEQPEATRAAFSDGWFCTGDLASRAADGYVTLHGRASELILCGGFNVYPREIEELLLEQAGVREAAVIGVADERRGERPLAFYAGDADPSALETACRRGLASFKVPVAFVRVDALPRNALGKVVKSELARPRP